MAFMADVSNWDRVPIEPQRIDAPLSRCAVFLVVTITEGDAAIATVRAVLSDPGALVRTVGFRDLDARLSCNIGIGSAAWDRLGLTPRPAQLRPFSAIRGVAHDAPSTPGDLLFHIRAERDDLCFEFEKVLLNALGDAVTVVDEVQGFRYFEARDLLGFVDGTENPTGRAMLDSALVRAADDPEFEGGSYVVVQKYLHDLAAWAALGTSEQEAIIGRTKADNVELELAEGTPPSHKDLTTNTYPDGVEHAILRDNMPFGRPGAREFGTYFIGYAGQLWVIEQMLKHMFRGAPPGQYDRILDVSTAVTGTTFFVPQLAVLESLKSLVD
jgi:putative iron-dependent peroxidase